MKAHATLKNLRISPRKTRLVTRALVGASIPEAYAQLSKQTKKASSPIEALIRSAVANATQNHGLEENALYIEDIRVGDGVKLKRFLPRAFGRASNIIRRGSNVTIIVTERSTREAKTEIVESPKKTSEKVSPAPKKETAAQATVTKKKVAKPAVKKVKPSTEE